LNEKLDHLIQTNKSTEQSLLLMLQEFKTLKADNIKLGEHNIRLLNDNLELKNEKQHINKDLSHFESLCVKRGMQIFFVFLSQQESKIKIKIGEGQVEKSQFLSVLT
jgi:hypothetical protein